MRISSGEHELISSGDVISVIASFGRIASEAIRASRLHAPGINGLELSQREYHAVSDLGYHNLSFNAWRCHHRAYIKYIKAISNWDNILSVLSRTIFIELFTGLVFRDFRRDDLNTPHLLQNVVRDGSPAWLMREKADETLAECKTLCCDISTTVQVVIMSMEKFNVFSLEPKVGVVADAVKILEAALQKNIEYERKAAEYMLLTDKADRLAISELRESTD